MRKMFKIMYVILVAFILLIIIFPINIYAKEIDKTGIFHAMAKIQKDLEDYGFEGTYNAQNGDNQELTWDMNSNIHITKENIKEASSTTGMPTMVLKYYATIKTKNMGKKSISENNIEQLKNKVREVLSNQGLEYNGELAEGNNRIDWKAHAKVTITDKKEPFYYYEEETKYKYKINIWGDNFVKDQNQVVWGIMLGFLEKVEDINDYRWVDVKGATLYTNNGNSMKAEGTIAGGTKVYVKTKYKERIGGRLWALLDNEKYIVASNLVDREITQEEVDAAQKELGNSGNGSNAADGGVISDGNAISFMNQGTAFTDPTTNANSYKPADLTTADTGELTTMAGTIIGIVRNIGVVLGVIFLTVLGLRYMFASIAEKAEYKETMMPYVLGAILLMAGTVLVDVIYHVATTW